jgi:hypothetical protein
MPITDGADLMIVTLKQILLLFRSAENNKTCLMQNPVPEMSSCSPGLVQDNTHTLVRRPDMGLDVEQGVLVICCSSLSPHELVKGMC